MGIISPRDFVDVILVKKYEDGTISSNGVQTFFSFFFFLIYFGWFLQIQCRWKSISARETTKSKLSDKITETVTLELKL